ncbi:hypothetical protein GJ744_008761 [Endocarpon pusillum]|uniref:Nucleoside phosphorylase domain-containing protein n=1 Tax=Endocarpon pusillum TaxID=364733 RepID=A0A8H7ASF1_9EURO|nr:hypothetical protein GJ744_008761 [Endocarpon pusillum]
MPPPKVPALANSEYQVGWICALSLEMAAARAMLEEIHGPPQEQGPSDQNSYCLGRIQKHNIVIACLPDYGTTSAAVVAEQMLHTFKEIRVGLMVGIGGGVPNPSNDIRMGDVIVSRPEGTIGGVVQYDLGKAVSAGSLQRTGCLDRPPHALLTALRTLESTHEMADSDIPVFLEEMANNYPKMRNKYVSPGPKNDRLFQEDYDHPEGKKTCEDCDVSRLVDRKPRESDIPNIHYGLIASGNQVIKNAMTRSRIANELGVLCFDMEAAGLMNHFKCLVIRGICDYCDSHKNDKWQPYAAVTAAAYAKELLHVVTANIVSLEKPIIQVADSKLQEIASETLATTITQAQEENIRHKEERHRKCHQIFKTSEYERHKSQNHDRVKGTCQWVLENPRYQSWLESSHNDLLWITADPGCGKSVLCRSLIDQEFKSLESYSVCYFFFKDNSEQNDLGMALCALLHQLFSYQPDLLHHAFSSADQNGEKLQKEIDELWRILLTSATDPAAGDVICILDALDECTDEGRMLLINLLTHFYCVSTKKSSPNSRLKFLVTSRPYDHIERPFNKITIDCPTIRLAGEEENELISAEIDIVTRVWVSQLSIELGLPLDLQEKLLTRLMHIENRTYLWLYLVFEEIRNSLRRTMKSYYKLIRELPESVDKAYEDILNKSKNKQETRILLSIIVAATRPLTLEEMDIALNLALATEDVSWYKDLSADLDGDNLKRRIRNLCGLFVYVAGSRVLLFHQTAKEFLVKTDLTSGKLSDQWKQSLSEQDYETTMTKICVRYLLLKDFEEEHLSSESELASPDDVSEFEEPLYDFMDYSAKYWPEHFQRADWDQRKVEFALILTLYDTNQPRHNSWSPVYYESKYRSNNVFRDLPCSHPVLSSIELAAFCGHQKVAKYFLEHEKIDADSRDDEYAMALFVACFNGHNSVVELLIENGAKFYVSIGTCRHFYGSKGTPLEAAAARGREATIRLLIEKDADVNMQGGRFGYALQLAAYNGSEAVVRYLIEKGADINMQGGHYGNVLEAAITAGSEATIRLLIEKGADVNMQGGWYGNALQAAVSNQSEAVVQLLIEKGADVNMRGAYGNALQAAVSNGSEAMVRLLIEKGADVNMQGGYYGNALQTAVSDGSEAVVRLLIEKGADVNMQGGYYGNALQTAIAMETEAMVPLLIEKGADVNMQGGYYGDALQAAITTGDEATARLLIQNGANNYNGALRAAASEGQKEWMKLLIQKGADDYNGAVREVAFRERKKTVHNWTPFGVLRPAAPEGQTELRLLKRQGYRSIPFHVREEIESYRRMLAMVLFLAVKGADDYNLALQRALEGYECIGECVERNMIDIIKSEEGRTLLRTCEDTLHFLMDKGADRIIWGEDYSDVLQAAVSGEHMEAWRLMTEKENFRCWEESSGEESSGEESNRERESNGERSKVGRDINEDNQESTGKHQQIQGS